MILPWFLHDDVYAAAGYFAGQTASLPPPQAPPPSSYEYLRSPSEQKCEGNKRNQDKK